ncbi:hypothetical protein QBC39DRAFT_314938 [Podospora conica]|nr:hypothetical protein QBC39DRAFT_314938 [Schizothecium conicum]
MVLAKALEKQGLIWTPDLHLNENEGSDEPGWWGDGKDQTLFPESEAQARSHIEWIRRTRKLDNPDANARALHAVLKQTAGRLYSDSTHFLLELVQNADDNKYQDNVVPSMTFAYQHGDSRTGGTLRVDSNENGFSSANIQSICSAGESTKADSDAFSDPEADRIGEKGVGFKAVFDVAQVVYINSGHYQFKFINKDDEILGIITPQWAPFPQPRLPGHTSILMELLPDYNPRRLIDALRSLDPSLLLFLNRLLEVKVQVREFDRSPWSTSFRYDGPGLGTVGMSTASIHHGHTTTSYYVYGKTLPEKDLAPDKRRNGATSSHVQIVFPFQSLRASDNPKPPTQSVFAFLPVRDYGLKFIVQADFLLVTSRESIDECPWNEALIANIPDIFVEAVKELNRLGKTYMWLPFVPLGPYQDRLLATLPTQTIARLSGSPVLESSLGQLALPPSLTFAPEEFRDALNRPLLPSHGSSIAYVSDNYPAGSLSVFKALGVVPLCHSVLLTRLGANHYDDKALCKMIIGRHERRDFDPEGQSVDDLISQALFLKANRWRSANGIIPRFWFATTKGTRCLGTDLYIDVISPEKPFSASVVFEKCRSNFNFLHEKYAVTMSPFGADWMSYLMKNSGLEILPRMTALLDPKTNDYHLSAEIRYLAEFDAAMVLRLLRHSWDFYKKWFVEDPRIRPDEAQPSPESRRQMRDEISRMKVRCLDGSMDELRNTFLPRRTVNLGVQVAAQDNDPQSDDSGPGTIARAGPSLQEDRQSPRLASKPALDVSDPEENGWNFLEIFGVVVKVDVRVFLSHLQQLSESSNLTKDNVVTIYELIQHVAEEKDFPYIRDLFATERLVYLSPEDGFGEGGRWVTLSTCVWDGPICFKRTPRLKHLYSKMYKLFIRILGCCLVAELEERVREAQMIDESDSLRHIEDVFRAICMRLPATYLPSPTQVAVLSPLKESRIFPIRTGHGSTKAFQLRTASDEDEWFVPDDQRASSMFEDQLNLCCLDRMSLSGFKPLFEGLGVGGRLLSVAARCEAVVGGQKKTGGHLYGRWLRKRIRFVIALIPPSISNPSMIIQKLQTMKFLRADVVTIQWTVEGFGKRISVAAKEAGHAALTQSRGELALYMVDPDPRAGHYFDETATQLAKFCGIEDAERSIQLFQVLSEANRKRTEERLKSLGYNFFPGRPEDGPDIGTSTVTKSDGKPPLHIKPPQAGSPKSEEIKSEETSNPGLLQKAAHKQTENPAFEVAGSNELRILDPQEVKSAKIEKSISEKVEEGTPKKNAARAEPRTLPATQDKTKAPSGVNNEKIAPSAREEVKPQSTVEPVLERFEEKPEEQPDETVEKGNITEPGEGKTSDDECKVVQGQWQTGPVLSAMLAVDTSQKGSRAADDSAPRADGADDFLNISKGWIIAPPTITILASGGAEHHTKYFGELFVSRFLEELLGKTFYDPNQHWTSPLRVRDYHSKFRPEHLPLDVSTFTVKDKSGKLQHELVRTGCVDAKQLSSIVEFHIQVVATKIGLLADFTLSNLQVQKMRRMSLRRGKRHQRAYILARVYGISKVPGVAMFVDPWHLMEKEAIFLESPSHFRGSIHRPSHAAIHREYVIETRREQSAIYQGFGLKQGEIRVIKLDLLKGADGVVEGGNLDSQPLSGSFEVVSRDKPPPYWAISYVWGPSPSGPKAHTFRTPQGEITLTESLTACLKCLRRKGVEAYIWVDALCINQSDNDEKGTQIRSLGSVYKKSERVIIWMGETGLYDERSPGIDWLRGAHRCKTAGRCDMTTTPNPGIHEWDDRWSDVLSILKQEWFVRTWIIQELVLGKNICLVYGQSEIAWDCFMASLFRGGDPILKKARPAVALHLTRQKHQSGRRFRFLELLELFSYTHATEPRDKLFAHLSMAYDVEEPIFNPDYNSREEIVLEKYARGLVASKRALELLRWAGSGKSTEFCKWIPDFLGRRFARTISTWKGGEHGFHAGKDRPAVARVKTLTKSFKRELKKVHPGAHPPPVLEIAGHIIGTVDGCFPLQMGNTDHEVTFPKAYADIREYAASIRNSYRFPTGSAAAASGPHAVDEMMLRTLIGDARGPRTESDWAWPAGFERAILELELGEDGHRSLNGPAESRRLMTAYWQTAAAFTRRIPEAAFVTVLPPAGRMAEQPLYAGVAPGAAEAGDVVFVANGGGVPFVLRRRGGGGYYGLVGECYLDGVMYGPPGWVERAGEDLVLIV